MTVNTYDVSDITIADSSHKYILSISEQLRNIRAEHHSKYLKSKWNKDAIPEKLLEKNTNFCSSSKHKNIIFRLMTPQINSQKVPSAQQVTSY